METFALFSPSPQAGLLLGASIAILTPLIALQRELTHGGRKRRLLLLASLAGFALCSVGFALGSKTFVVLVAVYVLLVLIATAVALLAEWRLYPTNLVTRLRHNPGGGSATVIFASGLILLVGTGIAIGVLVTGGGDGSGGSSIVYSSPYRISGTCANGACTVNECSDPSPCGLENEGRLREGTPVDIVCQTKGDMATSPNDHHSEIWDRLPAGLYISDLFVEGTRTNRFAPHLPHCSIA